MKARLQTFLAWTALAGLMLVLAVRMTLLEVTVRTVPHVSAGHAGQSLSALHFPGPAEIVGAGVVTVALTGVALIAAGKIRKVAWLLLALIVAILVLAVAGTLHAANRFASLVGVFDAGMGLLAGWAMFILCNTDRRRQWVVVVMVGLLTMLCVKGLYQRYVEIPETMHFFFKHEAQYAHQMGWKLNSLEMRLYIGRLNSQEVTGFFDLSDAFAEAMCPLLMLVAALGLALFASRVAVPPSLPPPAVPGKLPPTRPPRRAAADPPGPSRSDIPLPQFLAVCSSAIFLAGLAVIVLTKSKGGLASAVLCLLALLAAWRWQEWVARHRRHLAIAVVLLAAVGTAGLLIWGFHFHSLPTKSLKFRWQYWTGTVPMIFRHPLLGVGLNNFGYYYTQYKLPSAPEDVKNPHSVLIRVAAEMGLPAMVLWAAVIAIYFGLILEPQPITPGETVACRPLPFWGLTIFTATWWSIHFMVLGSTRHTVKYMALLDTLYGLAAVTGMVLASHAWTQLKPEFRRFVTLAGVLGAAGMLLYDQVNMAQVTSSVAMLFWMVLGALAAPLLSSGPEPDSAQVQPHAFYRPGATVGAFGVLGAVLAAVLIWVPIVRRTQAWDPARFVHEYSLNLAAGNLPAALRDAQAVWQRDTRSQNWLSQIITIKMRLGKDPAAQVQRMFALNCADARFRFRLVSTAACGLTPAQRVAQLQLALKLNAQLPPTEPARFSPRELAEIHRLISTLRVQKGRVRGQ